MAKMIDAEKLLERLQKERAELDATIATIHRTINREFPGHSTGNAKPEGTTKKRHLSAASRKALSNAAKKRWALAKKKT